MRRFFEQVSKTRVGAVDHSGINIASYSSKGTPSCLKPNILAPGTVDVGNESATGTSFSAPIISGICAAFFAKVEKDTTSLKNLLYYSSRKLKLPIHHQGSGFVDLEKMLEVLENENINNQSQG